VQRIREINAAQASYEAALKKLGTSHAPVTSLAGKDRK
jgi:hypothetical protein